ncbi:MAG: LysR family transcriptional regulator [Rhizobacter sp.]
MDRETIGALVTFVTVARHRSFTRAAAELGVSRSAVSHTMRALESRTGVRLLTRTTRSVSPTEAGDSLLQTLEPRFDEIQAQLSAVAELREKAAGTVRITATDYAANQILWPRLAKVLKRYPDLKIEITVDYGLADIVAQRFDIGVRLGDQVAKDMIAVRIAPDMRMAIVGSPGYFQDRPVPKLPQDLTSHNCINLRLPTYGGVIAWELEKKSRQVQVRPEGQATFNGAYEMMNAALCGSGLAYVPEDLVQEHIAAGRLRRVLEDWSKTFPGHHVYYPSRRQSSRALAVVVDALRFRPADWQPEQRSGATGTQP